MKIIVYINNDSEDINKGATKNWFLFFEQLFFPFLLRVSFYIKGNNFFLLVLKLSKTFLLKNISWINKRILTKEKVSLWLRLPNTECKYTLQTSLEMLIDYSIQYLVQLAKILLLPPKYKIIMLPSNDSFFQYCDSNIGLFSIAPCKVITLNPFCILFGISSCFFFDVSLSKVIALQLLW